MYHTYIHIAFYIERAFADTQIKYIQHMQLVNAHKYICVDSMHSIFISAYNTHPCLYTTHYYPVHAHSTHLHNIPCSMSPW